MNKKIGVVLGIVLITFLVISISVQGNCTSNSPEETCWSSILINRTSNSNIYNIGNNTFMAEIYQNPINMLDLNGEYEPYEEVTSFISDDSKMILQWNNKSVTFNFYSKDEKNNKIKFKDKTLDEKNKLKFKTSIKKNRGSFYFNHTLDKNHQPEKIGYDIETENVNCFVENLALICDEQKIDFADAYFKQGLNVTIKNNFIEISGDDLGYIDPTITLTGNLGNSITIEEDCSRDFSTADTYEIGADNTFDGDYHRSALWYSTSSIPDSVIISDVDFKYYIYYIDETNCDDTVQMNVYRMDWDDYDYTPDDDAERALVYDGIVADIRYAGDEALGDAQQGTLRTLDLGSTANTKLFSLLVSNENFVVGLSGHSGFSACDDEECYLEWYIAESPFIIPYIVVTYHAPASTTTHSATSPPGGASYESGTWTTETIQHYIACDVECEYVQYCTDTSNTCTPGGNYGTSEYINVSTVATSYFRWRGRNGTYYETTQSYEDKIGPINYTVNITQSFSFVSLVKRVRRISIITSLILTIFPPAEIIYNFAGIFNSIASNNTVSDEPPTSSSPAGESEINYTQINASDNIYATDISFTEHPYHKFDMRVEESDVNYVEVTWEGHTSVVGVVNLYVWNYTANNWSFLTNGSGTTDFNLTVRINDLNDVRQGTGNITFLVQD